MKQTLEQMMAEQGQHDVDTGWSATNSGEKIRILNLKPEQINIDDIAKSLSKLCRYNGHCDEFYSVAEHSVYVSRCCDIEDAKWGLLHDATEAYVGDMIRPVKNLPILKPYKELEDSVMLIICEKFGLDPEMPESVKIADNVVLMKEKDTICSNFPDWEWGDEIPRYPGPIRCLSPNEAERIFMNRFNELFNV